MYKRLIVHSAILVLIVGMSMLGGFYDQIADIKRHELVVRGTDGEQDMRISGLTLSSERIVLDYYKCENDTEGVAVSKLYNRDGVYLASLTERGSRDPSISEFAHINLADQGTEIIGDINLLQERAWLGSVFFYIALTLQLLTLVVLASTRVSPTSMISHCPDSVAPRDHLWARLQNGLLLTSAGALWYSVILYSSVITVLLPHLFREARDRCGVDFSSSAVGHYQMRTLGLYVRDRSTLNGVTIIMFGLVTAGIVVYSLWLFYKANASSISNQNLSRLRGLSWHCRVWPWQLSLVAVTGAVMTCFWVANLARERGYPLNMFYWTNGTKAFQKTGLSRTGTLLDFFQGITNLFTVSATVVNLTAYVWLLIIPAVATACARPVLLLAKAAQDVACLLLAKALVSWVTISPTTVSIMEKPECFDEPRDLTNVGWLTQLDLHNSCNDNMFSIHAVVVIVPAVIALYFLNFGGVIRRGEFAWSVYASIPIAAVATCTLIVLTRYQYTADIHIGACIAVTYMLTQSNAYRLLFDEDHNHRVKPGAILSDKIIPTISECITRIQTYMLASKDLAGLKASSEDLEEIAHLYRTVGEAMQKAKSATQHPAGDAEQSPDNRPLQFPIGEGEKTLN